MTVRPSGPEDIAGLLALYAELHRDDPAIDPALARERWRQLRNYPGSEIFVAEVGGSLVAACTLVIVPNLTRGGAPYGLIENVVTGREYRRRGYGRAALRAAIEAAERAGCYKVMLLTGSTKPATLEFYAGAGFEQSKTGFQIRLPRRER